MERTGNVSGSVGGVIERGDPSGLRTNPTPRKVEISSLLIEDKAFQFRISAPERSVEKSMREAGSLNPIKIMPHHDGEGYIILDGHCRVAVAILLGWTEINAERWSNDDMAVRWAGTMLLEAERKSRRVRGFRDMPFLVSVLRKDEVGSRRASAYSHVPPERLRGSTERGTSPGIQHIASMVCCDWRLTRISVWESSCDPAVRAPLLCMMRYQ